MNKLYFAIIGIILFYGCTSKEMSVEKKIRSYFYWDNDKAIDLMESPVIVIAVGSKNESGLFVKKTEPYRNIYVRDGTGNVYMLYSDMDVFKGDIIK